MSATTRMPASKPTHHSQKRPRLTFARLFLRAARRWQRNRAFNALSQLSDRQLEDIGVSRNDIPRVVKGMFVDEHEDTGPRHEGLVQDVGEVDVAGEPYSKAA